MASKWSSLFALCLPLLALERFEAVEPHMGTMVRVVVYARNVEQARGAFRAAFARVADLDAILSDYRPESELNLLCEQPSMVVSRDLFRVLAASQRLAEETDGAFDVTAGPLTRLWRQARKSKVLPDVGALEQARRLTGWRKLALDASTRQATLAASGMRLDVGGIGKGYAASEALARVSGFGIASAMVALSGDIAVSDPPPGKAGWGLRSSCLKVRGTSSCATRRYRQRGTASNFSMPGACAIRTSWNPATGRALTRRIAVSVVAPTGLEADGLDTAISVLGVERGLTLMKRHADAWALIVTEEGAFEAGRRP